MVVDRARGIGFCGLSERCDEAGAARMHDAFGLRATLLFDLAGAASNAGMSPDETDRLLLAYFGEAYREYMGRSWMFVPLVL